MSKTTAARPRQTTMAGVMVMLAAVFVVLSVWDTVSRLRSIETRESIERFLADAPGRDLGLSVEAMIQTLHAISVVAALCAVAAVALGWQVLQGSKRARIALSVVAVPLFITGLVAGGFMSSLVAAATAMLWLSPSREWFAGKPLPEPARAPSARTGTEPRSETPDDPRAPSPSGEQGQAHYPTAYPSAPVQPSTLTSPYGSPTGWSASADVPDKRPTPVTVALVLTIVVAGLVFMMTLISLVLLSSQPEVVLEELRRQNPDLEDSGVSESLLLTTSYVSGGLAMAWSAIAVVLAVLMAGRRAWAARALMVCAGACGLFSLLATLASPVALVPALAAVVTVSCLRRPDVRGWFAGPR